MMDINEVIKQIPFWNNLVDEEKAQLLSGAILRVYKKDSYIYGMTDACLGMIYVQKGSIRVYVTNRFLGTRSYIGAKTKKMQSRVKSFEKRILNEIEEKEGLLNEIEEITDLKLQPLTHHKERLIECKDFSLCYKDAQEPSVKNVSFEIVQGERVFLDGNNGCGKSSLIKSILAQVNGKTERELNYETTGTLLVVSGLKISYISQDTSHLRGTLKAYAEKNDIDYTLLLTLLRQLDFSRVQFGKDMIEFSEGQKKKVLIASSLLTPAHIYIWDEPLNYIDVFSRMQIEKLLMHYARRCCL